MTTSPPLSDTGNNAHLEPDRAPRSDPGASCEAAFSASLLAEGLQFDAPANLPLLESAKAAGIELESSCRNGTCRTCIRRLASGRVTYRIEWPGLSLDEKQQGYVLPCVAYPASDVVVE